MGGWEEEGGGGHNLVNKFYCFFMFQTILNSFQGFTHHYIFFKKLIIFEPFPKQVYEESCSRGWPGLGEEVSDICMKIGIPDVNRVVVSKEDINDALYNHHYSDMKQELEKSKKLNDIKHEDFKVKSVETTRMAFKVRSKMVSEIPENFKNKYGE